MNTAFSDRDKAERGKTPAPTASMCQSGSINQPLETRRHSRATSMMSPMRRPFAKRSTVRACGLSPSRPCSTSGSDSAACARHRWCVFSMFCPIWCPPYSVDTKLSTDSIPVENGPAEVLAIISASTWRSVHPQHAYENSHRE